MMTNRTAGWLRGLAGRFRAAWAGDRVPVILQMTQGECGPACLAMVLGYHGRGATAADCRDASDGGRDGVSVRGLVEAARRHGLRTRALSLEPAQLDRVPLPAIVHWNFDHFLVLERWGRRGADVVDPALGRRRMTPQEFGAGFSGVTLALEPGADFEPRPPGRSPWGASLRAFSRAPGVRAAVVQVLLASLLLQVLALGAPLFTRALVDRVLPSRLPNLIWGLGAGAALLALAQVAATYLRSLLLVRLQGVLDSRMMLGFFEHLTALPYRFFQQRTSGDLLMRLGSNMVIRSALAGPSLSVALDGLLVVVSLAALLWYDRPFGGAALGLGLCLAALLAVTKRRGRDLTQRHLAAEAESQGYLVQALGGIAAIKAAGAEQQAVERWSNLFFRELNGSLCRGRFEAATGAAQRALTALGAVLLLCVGAVRVSEGAVTLGEMLAMNALALSVLGPMTSLAAGAQQLQLVGAYLERVAEVLAAAPEQDRRAGRPAPRLSGRVEFRRVSFRYGPEAPWVLRDVSFTVEPGSKLALVGRSGSGKSTLLALLLGLYRPTEGEVLYEGTPLHELDLRALRRQLGVVLQEPFLFAGSVRANIAFGAPGCSLADVTAAARAADLHDEIRRLPLGYETPLAEGGAGLSGGQRQRLALAGALVRRPTLLLLDEATSHLDALSERRVEAALSRLPCTRLVIAHRLSTVRNADTILVLDRGGVKERGSHDELLRLGGLYLQLVRSQELPEELQGVPGGN